MTVPEGDAAIITPKDIRRPPALRAVIFDFGMVICSFDLMLFLRSLSSITGKPVTVLQNVLIPLRPLAMRYETGLLTTDEFYREAVRQTGLNVSRESFGRAYNGIFTPIPSTIELIRRLEPRYKLGLLSNTSEWHFEYGIKPVEIFPLFDAVTLSYEVKAMKPDERIYRDALSKLGMDAPECVYIDDLEENATAAGRLGMHAIHYQNPRQLLTALENLGVFPSV
jgi:epoxide hydrolase-like predicted phosphatase